jgi:rubredoxin
LLPALPAPPMLVRSSGGHFMDKPDNVISLINLATVRSLEAQWGVEIDPLRFRANIYIDGAKPWEEFDWIGGDIRIGGAVFTVDRKNGRCGATNVNPGDRPPRSRHSELAARRVRPQESRRLSDRARGRRDRDRRPGFCAALGRRRSRASPAHDTTGVQRRFICRGCYFIYEEANGLPAQSIRPGTPFADIPANWRCPDCGTDKTTFRPYVGKGSGWPNVIGLAPSVLLPDQVPRRGEHQRCSRAIRLDVSQRLPPIFCDFRVELVDQRRDRQAGAVAARFGETDAEVLAHPVDREAEIEFAGDHGLVAVLHLPGLRGALGDGGDQLFDIEAGFHGEMQPFRRAPGPARRCRSG